MFAHHTADVQSDRIGEGTKIWQGCVVLPGAVIGRNCNVNAHCLIEGKAVLGDHVTLKCGVYVWDGVTIEDDVFVGPNATFTNDLRPRYKRPPSERPKTLVRRGASIGAGATLVAPLVIGEHAMIGAGAVVTKDVPPYTLWYGNPAHLHGYVCVCGERLVATLGCGTCGRKYRQDGAAGLAPTE